MILLPGCSLKNFGWVDPGLVLNAFRWWIWSRSFKFVFHFYNPSLLAKRVAQKNNGFRFSMHQIILETEREPKSLDSRNCSQSLKFKSRLHSPKAALAWRGVFLWWGFVIGQLILSEKLSGVFRGTHLIYFEVKCPVTPLRCSSAQLRRATTQCAQRNLILAHFQQSKFNTVHTHRIALSSLGTLHWLCVCVVAQLHALSAQQN